MGRKSAIPEGQEVYLYDATAVPRPYVCSGDGMIQSFSGLCQFY